MPESIDKLIERFKEHLDAYKSGKYNETQLRREFVDPFFESLGWDVGNRQSYAEAYKDVVHEDALRIDATVKSPDYSFRVSGLRKFFVETKKPSVVIKDEPAPAYQLRRYAWSAKLPLSILTDFEEFAVYDTRIKPEKTDKASTARVIYMKFNEYPERWHEIESVFARESVLKGAFDKYSATSKQKRGTSSVDDAFLSEIESWRDMLAKNIAIRNPDLSQRELNFSVQRTIDRIVFLRISEDRGLEDYGNLLSNSSGVNVYKRLVEVFSKADQRYNSGLFHFERERDRHEAHDTLTPRIIIDDKPLKDIIKRIYYPESPYEFSVFPADILGQVYEQFLGKVIRLTTSHRAVVEEKPEVKKAGGIYYTPTYIVDYIVKNTVGELLKDKTPKQVSALRILDPACGSGSFLIGAFQYLLDWHRQWYVEDGAEKWASGKKPVLYQARGGDWRLTTQEKKRVLINNIYGVDIDTQAVEVSKLSLLLKVLENENSETISSQLKFFHERALPDLGDNIKCGNSLIGTDFYNQQELLDDEERLRINVFDWHGEFAEVFKAGGFDAVIGNPPYVRQEALGEFKDYFKTHYKVYQGTADLYSYFIEQGVSLLNERGVFGYIVANKWMRANYGEALRKWLKQAGLEEITDFGDLPVFKKATTYPCILKINKAEMSESIRVTQVKNLDFDDLSVYVKENSYKVQIEALSDDGWSLSDERSQGLLNKLNSVGKPLGEYVDGKIYRGVLTGLNEAFVIDEETKDRLIQEDPKSAEIIKPFLLGRDIKRYETPKHKRYLIFTRRGIDIEKYPAIMRHLLCFKNSLMPKPKDYKGKDWKGRKPGPYKWFEVQDAIDYYAEFEKPKIIYPNICKKPEFTFDSSSSMYTNQKCFIIPSSDKYLLGILNSSVMFYIFRRCLPKLRGDFYEPSYVFLKLFPIRVIDFSNPKEKQLHDRVVSLVERMLELKKKPINGHEGTVIEREIQATDRQIDRLVYELYGLTEEEIGIVEGKK